MRCTPHRRLHSGRQTKMKTVTWFCNIDASVGMMNSKQNAVDFCERQETKGSQFWFEQVQYINFYSSLAKKSITTGSWYGTQKIIRVKFSMLSPYFRINCSSKIKLNKTNPSHLFFQLLKSVVSEADALTRLLYETLYRELVKCNKLQVLAEFVKVAFQKSFPDPSWLHWYSLHTTFKNLSSLHLWQAHRKKNCVNTFNLYQHSFCLKGHIQN